jgi:MoxR-like ATPase
MFRGARQVGKSTLVRLLAQELGVPLHEINLERHTRLNPIFASRDIQLIRQELEFAIGHESLDDGILFLDEIQATPAALAALRDFYEQTSIAVIAAFSRNIWVRLAKINWQNSLALGPGIQQCP